jgi:hypothetical protein
LAPDEPHNAAISELGQGLTNFVHMLDLGLANKPKRGYLATMKVTDKMS